MTEESTTLDLLEAMRRSLAAIGRREWAEAVAPYRPDAVWDMSSGGLGVFAGREAIRGFFEDWWGAYQDFEQEVEQFRDFGHGVTLLIALARAQLPGSGGLVELRYAGVHLWIEGMIQHATLYTDINEARAAAAQLAEERAYASE